MKAFPLTMDRRLAQRNLRTALVAGAVCFFMFSMGFLAAALYVLY